MTVQRLATLSIIETYLRYQIDENNAVQFNLIHGKYAGIDNNLHRDCVVIYCMVSLALIINAHRVQQDRSSLVDETVDVPDVSSNIFQRENHGEDERRMHVYSYHHNYVNFYEPHLHELIQDLQR